MTSADLKPFEERMKKSISVFEEDLSAIRVGRANPKVLDKITIDYYGVVTPLNQTSNITVPEARMLQIQPWDASSLQLIEKAIQQSDLGINPANDGKVIRLVFPELTEERRKELSKEVKKSGEETKVAVRNIRREAIDFVKGKEKKKEISEDQQKTFEEEIQKITDKMTENIDKIVEEKSKEIMSI